MLEEGNLHRTVKSASVMPAFEQDLAAHEICITDSLIDAILPALRENSLLEDRLSVINFDGPFATFIILPRPWRKQRAPRFDEKLLEHYFPELNINYQYRTSDTEVFRFKVFLHYERESEIYRAIASFDEKAYIFGVFLSKPWPS